MGSSENEFRIFVSSTCYNLIDLRAELSRYLGELGYKPILSDEQGFPDMGANYKPWETCLKSLENCFVVLVVIDKFYGRKFEWLAFDSIFKGRSLSPTHAEYLYARNKKKRIFVFVRDEVACFYQSYRRVMDDVKNDKASAEKVLRDTLPNGITFETLEFFAEVKTSEPIPWIVQFKDVTQIKDETRKRLLNELTEIFRDDLMHYAKAITKALDDLPNEKRDEVLSEVPNIALHLNQIKELRKTIDDYSIQLIESKKNLEIERARGSKKATELEYEVFQLGGELVRLRNMETHALFDSSSSSSVTSSGYYPTQQVIGATFSGYVCKNCGMGGYNPNALRVCRKCNNYFCVKCSAGTPDGLQCKKCGYAST